MKLRRVELESFRAFGSARIDLPESGLVLVAGVISAGKSALLSALDVIAFGDQPAQRQNYRSASVPRITATFRLDDAERGTLLLHATDQSLLSSAAFREVTWQFTDYLGTGLGVSELKTSWPGPDALVLLRATPTEGGQLQVEMNEVQATLSGQPPREPGLTRMTIGTNDINVLRSQMSSTAFRPLGEFLQAWSNGLYHFKALRPGTSSNTYPGRADQKLAPTGENLPAVLNDLYHNRREVFEDLKVLVQRIVPGIGELHLPQQGTEIQVSFTDPDSPTSALNLKSLGTGVEQLLMTLVVGLTGEGPTAVILEEPETNLHPGAQRALLTLIRDWSSTKPYILATHSPVFLDASLRAEVLLVTRQAGVSDVKSLGTESLEALDNLGVRLSDVLSADRLLLVEGPSDAAVLTTWLPDYLTNPRLAIIQASGGDNARYARHLQEWLSQADRLADRRVLYLRDRDELPASELAKLESTGVVKVALGRELENYLLDEAALTVVIQARKQDQPVTADAVAQVMRQVADSLRRTVVLKRVCRERVPIRLVENDLRKKLG
jgi:predicted ATPase